ncbi:MAG: dihydrolipoyl dehydrogenase family protein [Candidatus Binatia bacterium]
MTYSLTMTCDVAVLGGGPGGMAAALSASTRGMRVVLIDGGGFLGYGLHGAYKSKGMWELAKDWIVARKLGYGYVPSGEEVRFNEIHARLQSGVEQLTAMYLRYLALQKVQFIHGFARFLDPNSVEVNGQRISAKYFIIATGSKPRPLPGVTVDGRLIMTSDEIVDVEEGFDSLIVVGAGVLGCEFASIFSAFGVHVTILDSADRLMGSEDPDISDLLTNIYQKNGVSVRPSVRTKSIRAMDGEVKTELEDGSVIVTARALLAIGRISCSDTLNIPAAGVEADIVGTIPVNDSLQTNVAHIYAVGDVGQRNTPLDLALVQVAEAEGRMAVKHICGEDIDTHPDHIPFIIFTMPMIAGAGLTETQARKRHGNVRVAKFLNLRNHRYHAMRSSEGFLKLIVGPPGDDRVLGVRAVGAQADNVIGEVAVLIDNKIPYTYLLDCIHAHPSLAESLQNAARIIAGLLPPRH